MFLRLRIFEAIRNSSVGPWPRVIEIAFGKCKCSWMDDRLGIRLWTGTARGEERTSVQGNCNEADKHAEAGIPGNKMCRIEKGLEGGQKR